jgi:hypothetical protein
LRNNNIKDGENMNNIVKLTVGMLFFAGLMIAISIASASDVNNQEIKVSDLNTTFIQQTYDATLGDLPDSYQSLIGDNRIALRIKGEDEKTYAFGLVTKNGQLVETIEGDLTKPTIEIDVKESAILNLQQAEDPVPVFDKALEDKDISVKGNGFINKMKADILLGQPMLPELIAQLLTPVNKQQVAA